MPYLCLCCAAHIPYAFTLHRYSTLCCTTAYTDGTAKRTPVLPKRRTGAMFRFLFSQPFNLAVKSAMASEIFSCWGQTFSQLRQPMQALGHLS